MDKIIKPSFELKKQELSEEGINRINELIEQVKKQGIEDNIAVLREYLILNKFTKGKK